MQRLHRRFWKLTNKGKHHNVVVTAVARELVGFLWAVLSHGNQTANGQAYATAS